MIIILADNFSGTLFNLYEIGLYLIQNGLDVYWHYNNYSVDFTKRYCKSLSILDRNYVIKSEDSVISGNCSVYLNSEFENINKYFILLSANFSKTMLKCIKKIRPEVIKDKMKKTIFINNPEFEKLENIKNQVEYRHGVFKEYFITPDITNNPTDWLTTTSEYVDDLSKLRYEYISKEVLNNVRSKYESLVIDNLKSLTPFYDYKGYVYIKNIDAFPRTPNEFLVYNKPVMIESISVGLNKLYHITEYDIGKDLRDLGIKPRYAEFDIYKFKYFL